jgi:AAT family amino acid transporter
MADKGLSVWHLTMLALGTVIGGSFFLGSGIAIRAAGPGIFISYLAGGVLVYIILTALSEMTVAHPVSGSFRTYAQMIFGPGVGFVLGWVYWTGLILAMSSEATAASILIRTWFPGLSITAISITIIIGITLLNLINPAQLSALESGLVAIKLFAILGFIVLALGLVTGLMPGRAPLGFGVLTKEPLLPGGLAGIAGSMLIVMFAYAGFEVIGLAAPDAANPQQTVKRAIAYTITGLVSLYILSITVLLPLVRTAHISAEVSPLVLGLASAGLSWGASVMNLVLITAILSTMLAAVFGLGRMVHSLAGEGYAPLWLKEDDKVPRRGIIFSGLAMLAGVGVAHILPNRFYLFLVSSGGFALLFAYCIILATHYKFRRIYGCPPKDNCQLAGYPYTSIFGLAAMIIIIISMPLVPGQGSGLFAGLILVLFFIIVYWLLSIKRKSVI